MKRGPERSEAQDNRQKLFRRQEPVSCEFCRRKKLKCDRGSPCSNCRARKLACSSAIESPQSFAPEELSNTERVVPLNHNINELNDRVRKLEALLAQSQTSTDLLKSSTSSSYAKPRKQSTGESEYSKTVTWLETDAFEHVPICALGPDDCSIQGAFNGVADNFGSFIFSLSRPRISPALGKHSPTILPSRARGKVLFDYYTRNVNWIYHILHVPTVEKQMGDLYSSFEQELPLNYGHLALISTIFSLSAYYSSLSANLFSDTAEAMGYCRRWTLLAQDALSTSNCLVSPTIETLQSLILISQHLMPNIGAVATLRTLAATIISAARELKLHRLDSLSNRSRRKNTQVDWVEVETKRRLWWHITSTDWILSFMGGAQCGTYMIQPQQMNCDWPTNVDDIDITPDGNYAQGPEKLTEMTYFILRIRFCEVFRGIVDAAWKADTDIDDLPYETVLEMDKRLSGLLVELEQAYRPVTKNRPAASDKAPSRDRRQSVLLRQRDMGLFGVHTRITRLHRPYLIRGAQDSRYAYSRMVSLRSARTVIEIGSQMTRSQKTMPDLVSIKIWTLNHHLFISAVILVMDYCFNKDEPRAKERKEEILECFRLLSEAKNTNTIAARGLMKLREMLKKAPQGENTSSSRPSSSGVDVDNPAPTASPTTVRSLPNSIPQASSSAAIQQPYHPAVQNIVPEVENSGFVPIGFEEPPPYAWSDWTSQSFDDFNFDVNLDASQFEALFRLESNNEMF